MSVTQFDELLNAICEARRHGDEVSHVRLTEETTHTITEQGASHISKGARSRVANMDVQTGADEDAVVTESGETYTF